MAKNKTLKRKIILRIICTNLTESLKDILLSKLSQLLGKKKTIVGTTYQSYWKFPKTVECSYLIRSSKKIDLSTFSMLLDERFIKNNHELGPVLSRNIDNTRPPFLLEEVEWATLYYAWKGVEKFFVQLKTKPTMGGKVPYFRFKRYPTKCKKRSIIARRF